MSLYDVSVALRDRGRRGLRPTFAYPVVQLAAERRDPAALPFALGAILRISRTLAVPGAVQEAWVRRRGTGDDRLFLAGNVALGLAAAAMAAVVIAHEPIAPALVAISALVALALIAALVRRPLR